MTPLAAGVLLFFIALIAALLFWRRSDHESDRDKAKELASTQPQNPEYFHPDLVADLPEVGQRFFNYMIKTGTPLCRVANLGMKGQFGMGDKTAPNYLHMTATQTLALPTGFIWKMDARGTTRLSGSDSEQWTRMLQG